jgi:hypothetical protein
MANKKVSEATESSYPEVLQLGALLDAWGIAWADLKAKLDQAASLLPAGQQLTVADIIGVLDGYITRIHMSNMLAAATAGVYTALKTGKSEVKFDPSSLS